MTDTFKSGNPYSFKDTSFSTASSAKDKETDENEILSQAGMERLKEGFILKNLSGEESPKYYVLHEDDVITYEKKAISYKTVYKKDSSLKRGEKKVIQKKHLMNY